MIINHRSHHHHSIKAYPDHPLPFRPSILTHILILIVFIIYFAHLVQILSRQQISFPKSITPQVRYDIRLLTEIDDISVFWLSLESSPYPNRHWYQKTHLPCSSTTFNLLGDIIKLLSFNHYPFSQSQCHTFNLVLILPRLLALATTSREIRTIQQSRVSILSFRLRLSD